MNIFIVTLTGSLSRELQTIAYQLHGGDEKGVDKFTVLLARQNKPGKEENLFPLVPDVFSDPSSFHPQIITREKIPELVRYMSQHPYDLAVIDDCAPEGKCTPAQKRIRKQLLDQLSLPCLFVKQGSLPLKRILICDSGSGKSQLIKRFYLSLKSLLNPDQHITVLHVMSQISAGPGVRGSQLRAEADDLIKEHTLEGEILRKDLALLQQEGLNPTPKVRHGLVVDEILAEIHEGDYDLTVIGTHEEEGWEKLLLENIARKIVLQSRRSVLVIR